MPFVRSSPNQFLLTGHAGRLVNRGSAVGFWVRPGTIWVVVPATKQEAPFEFTQETRDGIPLRFKGMVIYRVTDPVATAQTFDFTAGNAQGVAQVSTLLTHVCLGELRHAVSHMTMTECIEERKTTLSGVVRAAVEGTIGAEGDADGWGIRLEVAQVAQVFIVDTELRARLEAEARNAITLRSEQSNIKTAEEARLAEMASAERVAEQKLAADRDALRRREAMAASELAAQEARITAETPVRLLKLAHEGDVLREELALQELRNRLRAGEVEHELLRPRAEQEMRREILPLEQAPQIVEAASKVFQGASLAVYGDDAALVGQVTPLLEVLGQAVRQATTTGRAPAAGTAASS